MSGFVKSLTEFVFLKKNKPLLYKIENAGLPAFPIISQQLLNNVRLVLKRQFDIKEKSPVRVLPKGFFTATIPSNF